MLRTLAIGTALVGCGGGSHPTHGDAAPADTAAMTDARPTADADLPPTGWPGPTTTGVPPGTTLTPYAGACLITTAGTVIDGKTVDCDLEIHAANVVIENSKVNGLVFLDADLPGADQWSFTLQDSEVNGGPVQRAVVSDGNMTVLRSNIYGGETAVHCSENAVSCVVRDSWLHGQYLPDDQPWHLGGFQSNGGTGIEIRHNSIVCDHAANSIGEGCTGDLNLIPDFAVVSNATIDDNRFGANLDASFCTYGGDKSTSPYPKADHVAYTNNVFARGTNQLCGTYGPVAGFDVNGTGNQWVNNTWEDDGSPVEPAE